jgi:hypothetical protein
VTTRQSLLLPTAFFLFVVATFYAAGLRTEIPFFLWQILPIEALTERPFESLFLLHSQPPLINFLVLVFYKLEAWTGIHHDQFATAFNLTVAWCFCYLFFQLAHAMTRSIPVSCALAGLLVTNPGFVRHLQGLYYTPIVPVEILLVLFMAMRFRREPRRGSMMGLVAALLLVVYTRSVWHPLFGIGVLVLACFPWPGAPAKRGSMLAQGLTVYTVIAAAWMLKNAILFGSFSFSTWLGYNLGGVKTDEFAQTQKYDEEIVRAHYSQARLDWLADKPAVAQARKNFPAEAGSVATNMNHFAVAALGAADTKTRVKELMASPKEVLERCFFHLARFDMATYANPYTLDTRNGYYDPVPLPSRLDFAFRLHDQLYYGSWSRALCAVRWGGVTWRPSYNFLFVLPLALLGGLGAALRRNDPEAAMVARLALILVAWFLAMMLLIDGREASRIRWEIEPLLLLLLGNTIRWAIASRPSVEASAP